MLKTSLYYKIYEYYKNLIQSNQLKSGEKLPTEQEVCEIFNTSRITARHAFELLVNQGLVVKVQGKGTYVSVKKTDMKLNKLQGFSAEMSSLGKKPSTIILNIQLTFPSKEIAELFEISESGKVYIIERIRCADGVKMAYEKVHLPFYFVPDIDKYDLTGSLYSILERNYHINSAWANQTLEATLANPSQAGVLDVKVSSPLLVIKRLSYDQNNQLYEYTESLYRGDKYTFSVTMNK
ncbi:MAG: GntR family transcriptional regulator [Bacilli bacterium]|nr:GntR family transcriptional regulator [Bacilli bacterium]